MTRVIAWTLAAISALVVPLAAAPFTAAVFLVAPLLLLAAVTAWKGQMLPSAIVAILCATALAVSPIRLFELIGLPIFLSLVVLGFVAVAASVIVRKPWRPAT
ncbi:hypothetical protein [Thauera sp.]|uniref:hypothetical protein n=1 Tax=Thauera sp. TaxID=1905334 RepID=UPI0039E36961